MIALVLVNQCDNLGRACADLSGFFRTRRPQQHRRFMSDTLLGFWIEPHQELECRDVIVCDSSTGRSVHMAQSLGVCGIWTLLYYDTPHLARMDVLDALVASAISGDAGAVDALFAPVFPDDTPRAVIRFEMDVLRAKHAHHLSPPLLQCQKTGRILFPANDAEPSKPQ